MVVVVELIVDFVCIDLVGVWWVRRLCVLWVVGCVGFFSVGFWLEVEVFGLYV